jgi:hypothetical protein
VVLRARTAPFFLRREKKDVMPPEDKEAAAGEAGASSSAAAAQAAGAAAGGGPRPQAMGRKNDLVVWLKLTPMQKHVYSTFLSSDTVKAALNSTK